MSRRLPNPYAPRVRTRYLHQLRALAPTLRRWRRALFGLRDRPHEGDRGALLRAAWDRVPFWQRRFTALGIGRHELDDPALWSRLPITTRADVQRHGGAMRARAPRALIDDAYEGCTSGSTGEPVRYRMGAAAYHSFLPMVDLALDLYAARRRPRPGRGGIALLDALGHSPSYGAWMPLFHGTRFRKITVGRAGWAAALAALDPVVITGDPDSLAALLDIRPARSPGIVLSSAFAMPDTLARDLRRHLGCPVVEYYSAQEVGPIALADPAGRWRVLTPFVFAEDAALSDGGSRLLITDLRNPLMPLIRYAVGDLGRVCTDPGGPLRTPVIEGFTGRVAQRFAAPDGRRFDPAGLAPSLARLPLRQYRVAQVAADRATLEYFGPRTLEPGEVQAVRERLSTLAGASMTLDARRVAAPLRSPGVKPTPFVPLGGLLDARARGNHDAPVAGRARRIYVALTNACNRACPWCSTHSDPGRSTYLAAADFDAILPADGPFEVQLEGGEPTLHPMLFDFVERARATGRCRRYVLCTNGVRLPRKAVALDRWLARWPRPFTVKISVNHHLIERDETHLDGIRALADAIERVTGESASEARADISLVINLRRRPAAPDRDAWVLQAVRDAGLMAHANDFWLQRYGKAADDESLEPPYLAGTDFELINPDGRRWGTDLIGRSEAMGRMP